MMELKDYYVINSCNKNSKKQLHETIKLLNNKGYKKIMKEYKINGDLIEYYKKKKNKKLIILITV